MESYTAQDTEIVDPIASSYFDYQKVKPRLDRLIGDWSYYRDMAIRNVNARYINLNPEELRQKGSIGQDETMISCRVIDYNIMREKADAMNFLNSSGRLAYFNCVDDPNVDARQLESEFTKGLTYDGWYTDFDRHYDAAALHGWDSMEIEYDETKPLHVAINEIGFEKLIYNIRVRDIEDSAFLLIQLEVSALNLEEFVRDYQFDPEQVRLLVQPGRDFRNDDKVFCIYKVYFKYDNCVYIAWYSKETPANGWLKEPEHLRLGLLVPIPEPPMPSIGTQLQEGFTSFGLKDQMETPLPPDMLESSIPGYWEKKSINYPVKRYTYIEDCQQCISDKKGRAFLDLPQQEATTAITSGIVNRAIKAARVFASVDGDADESNRVEDITLDDGSIIPIPIKFFSIDMPSVENIQILQYMDAVNSQQTGKMAVSVSNRQDSRKTAKELSLAENEQSKISSTSLATYNDFLRGLYVFAWPIVQSQALAGRIKLLQKVEQVPGISGIPETRTVNDVGIISKKYDLRAAGEIDVIQKQQQMNSMQQDWPVISATPIAQMFLEDFIRLRYPNRADQYIAALRQGDPGKQVASSLLGALAGMVKQDQGKLQPEQRDQLANIMNSAMAYLQPPQEPGKEVVK